VNPGYADYAWISRMSPSSTTCSLPTCWPS
jgi:hypothetical protein